MPFNEDIPGQINLHQMRAIECVATLVPENGHVVEVGSLFGASSWAWSKSVTPSATIHCIDPWEGNQGIRAMEERLGITYGLEQFKIFTADCHNIEPHKGYSPNDFEDWDQPIDLYYEDAVHTDPILSRNLDFWIAQLKPTGIVCGDDYRGRFPDVRGGAHRKASEMGRELIVIEHFWCLLPPPHEGEGSAALEEVRAALLAQQAAYRAEMEAKGPHATWAPGQALEPAGEAGDAGEMALPVTLTQAGLLPWPQTPAPAPLTATLTIAGGEGMSLLERAVTLETRQLSPDIAQSFHVPLSAEEAAALQGGTFDARLEVTAPDMEAEIPQETPMAFEPRSLRLAAAAAIHPATPAAPAATRVSSGAPKGQPHPALAAARTDPKSREFFLQFSRRPAAFGVTPVGHGFYDLRGPDAPRSPDAPDVSERRVRSTLSPHEIALCYALAGLSWSGEAIVDLGPGVGASTWAFAKGLTDAGYGAASSLIHAFDPWISSGGYTDYLSGSEVGAGGSLLGQWTKTLEGYHHLVEPHQGDLLDIRWDGRPIGLLCVGLARSVALHDHILATMVPCLRPGAVLVHRDHLTPDAYWVAMEMARLSDYFEPCYTLREATTVYRCIKDIPAEICRSPSSGLPYAQQVALLEEATTQAPAPAREVLKCAAASHALDHGDQTRAQALLSSVETDLLTENGVQDFSDPARSHLKALRGRLAAQEGQSAASSPGPSPASSSSPASSPS